MSQPFPVEIISDEEEDNGNHHHHRRHHHHNQQPLPFSSSTSPTYSSKKRRTSETDQLPNNIVVLLDDDPTPKKPNPPLLSTPSSFVPESPLSSDPFKSDFSIQKCSSRLSDTKIQSLPISSFDDDRGKKFSGGSGLICLESDNESEDGMQRKNFEENECTAPDFGFDTLSQDFGDNAQLDECFTRDAISEVRSDNEADNVRTEEVGNAMTQKHRLVEVEKDQNSDGDQVKIKKRKTNEEKVRLAEEKKLKREQEKLQKKALKDEAAAAKKLQKEQKKLEKGKFALKSIVAEIDAKVVELGAIGGHLITRFADKGLSFRITSNPIERSILWKMSVPEHLSELSSTGTEIPYVLLVYEADEFCNLLTNESLMDHVSGVQSLYSSHTVCYLTNKLMAYINRREQAQYKNQASSNLWRRPPVEEVLSKLTTDFASVHSRQCRDEFELADHVVGLTCALASCQFRKKLTRLSIYANGAMVPKDSTDKNLIKKNIWLKALVAIPKVQPRFAIAIWKKYPTMKSLLSVYMDPSISVHEKEFLLKDLRTEGLLGDDRRVGAVCSKRVYRILMAQNGNIKTDDVEHGADFFGS